MIPLMQGRLIVSTVAVSYDILREDQARCSASLRGKKPLLPVTHNNCRWSIIYGSVECPYQVISYQFVAETERLAS